MQQLKQQLADVQQHKADDLQALVASNSDLEEQLAAVTTEADKLWEQLSSTAQELQVPPHVSTVWRYLGNCCVQVSNRLSVVFDRH